MSEKGPKIIGATTPYAGEENKAQCEDMSYFSRVPQLLSEPGLEPSSLNSLAGSLPFHHEGANLRFLGR